ncbi:type II toxin-antitoxin system RelE/ParE family toxin [Phenylobacterium montanum]|uniref:Type II toxin-antitoxin system RelE/ParE family toxin n=1 Tax=Phenylobacterium montanum TaxID=2823693 RepID=A0A975G4T7_9CAUL|nr:type II toxin-antitoxin system RelE/ParE family toxin [Caulobacter sp. S6]QUD90593.1 type II toxin-antitoxin system RelE/ParE family toxin [Caulobacter sp. S6]
MRRLELTISAQADLAAILDISAASFGAQARRRYETIIEIALGDLLADPTCLGSLERPELGPKVRTYHLRYCRGRGKSRACLVGHPRHLLVYEFDDDRVLVLRVLHDAMELTRHLPPNESEER